MAYYKNITIIEFYKNSRYSSLFSHERGLLQLLK